MAIPGLALPYFAVAAMPGLVRLLPKPGRWMIWLKSVLGLLLVGTAAWLIWVLAGVADLTTAITVTGLLLAAMFLLGSGAAIMRRGFQLGVVGGLVLAALLTPLAFPDDVTIATPALEATRVRRRGTRSHDTCMIVAMTPGMTVMTLAGSRASVMMLTSLEGKNPACG